MYIWWRVLLMLFVFIDVQHYREDGAVRRVVGMLCRRLWRRCRLDKGMCVAGQVYCVDAFLV